MVIFVNLRWLWPPPDRSKPKFTPAPEGGGEFIQHPDYHHTPDEDIL